MVDEISLMNPVVGIESVGRYDPNGMTLPPKSEAKVVGAKIQNNLEVLYDSKSVEEQARELTAPHFSDNAIYARDRFDAFMYDTADKMQNDSDGPATSEMQNLKETRMQWRQNSLALNMA